MARNARRPAALFLGALALAGLGYTALAIARVRRFRDARPAEHAELPGITVFKPLHGNEPHLYENLRTFCDQDYPAFQIVFCAARPDDPALAIARRLEREFPGVDVQIAAGNPAQRANPKIANVLGAYGRARHGLIAIADSDISVGRGYLRSIASAFSGERTGAVTCLYGAVPNGTIASLLGALHVNDGFAPSVLVARAIEPLTYCFGATMAVRRDVLERAGGLETIADYLGDDYLLGQAVVRSGYRVELVPYIVQTSIHEETIAELVKRELRWARTIAAVRPAGFAGSVVTYALPISIAFAAVARTRFSAIVAGAAAALRMVLHCEAAKTFAPGVPLAPALVPVRDALSLAIWLAAFFGRRVDWRSHGYSVQAGGRMADGPNGV